MTDPQEERLHDTPMPEDVPLSPRPPTGVPQSPWTKTPPPSESGEIAVDDILEQRSKRVKKLGEGGHSEVWLVEHLGQLEAHKFVTHEHRAHEAVFREALHTRKVKHPNIVQVYGTEIVDGLPVLRMEYIEGKDLATQVDEEGVLPVEQLLPIAIQAADALRATHERGILHRDLKPANLLMRKDKKTVVVTDFGVAAVLDEAAGAAPGTPRFMAPELYEVDGRATPASDIWSFGVTLYYLLTLSYPYRFGETDPENAIKEEPHDPSTTHLYVPPELSAILLRMLAADPRRRPASMEDVRKELELLKDSIRCPACSQYFALESVTGACPNPDCQAEGMSSFKRGWLERAAAETKLAECDFKGSRTGFKAAAGAFEQAGAEKAAADVRTRLERMKEYETSLPELVDAVAADLERERYIDATASLQKARSRFSRAGRVRELRANLRERMGSLYESVGPDVAAALAQQDFPAATKVLNRIDRILGDRAARRELEAALGKPPEAFRQLHEDVAQKELTFARYADKGREAILAFDFEKALRVYTALENDFPSDHNVEMLARLRRAPDTYAYACKYKKKALAKVIAEPVLLAAAKRIRLKRVHQACRKLLNDFPETEYETFSEIRELKDLTARAIDSCRKFVQEKLEEAKQAEEEQDATEELRHLHGIEPLITRSDLFDVSVRQHVIHRLRALEETMSKAEAHYADGMRCMENREYVQAQVSFREVLKQVPEGYKDVEERLQTVTKLREDLASRRQEVSYELGEIARGKFSPESAVKSMATAYAFYDLAGDQQRGRVRQRMAQAAIALMDSQKKHLAAQPEARADQFLRTSFLPILETLPTELWLELSAESADLSRSFCTLLEDAFGHGAGRDLEAEVEAGQQFREAILQPAAQLVRETKPPLGCSHPVESLAKRVTTGFEHARRAEREKNLAAAVRLLRDLEPMAKGPVKDELGRRIEGIEAWGRKAALEERMRRVKSMALRTGPFVGAFLFGLLLGWFFFKPSEKDELERLASSYSLGDGTHEAVVALLEKRATRGTWIVRLGAWNRLRTLLEKQAGGRELGSYLYLATVRGLPKRLSKPLNGDLAKAAQQAVLDAFARAARVVEEGGDPQAVTKMLADRIGELDEIAGGRAQIGDLSFPALIDRLNGKSGTVPRGAVADALNDWNRKTASVDKHRQLVQLLEEWKAGHIEANEFHERIGPILDGLPEPREAVTIADGRELDKVTSNEVAKAAATLVSGDAK